MRSMPRILNAAAGVSAACVLLLLTGCWRGPSIRPTTPEVRLVEQPIEVMLDLPANLIDQCEKPRLERRADGTVENAALEAYILRLQASIDEC